jgi:ABC-type phosphate transport system substrate-binding protein
MMSLRSLIIFGTLVATVAFSMPSPAYGDVAIIAHKDVPEDSLTEEQLRDIYAYDIRQWSNMQTVVVLDLKLKSDVRSAFYDYLGKSSSRMKSVWMKKMLLGEGDPPEVVADEETMIARVAALPGAIGFADAANVPDSVKVLAIIPAE